MLPDIFHQLPAFTQSAPHAYIQRKAWLIRQDKLHGLMRDLRTLPGLHKRRLLALWRDNMIGKAATLALPAAYDALQINEGAFRLRAFDIPHKKTIKIVLRASPYGPGTLRELEMRTGLLKNTTLKIPAIHSVEAGETYIQFEEELLIGRAFHAWRDAPHFMREVGTPLMALYDTYGIIQKPLTESMDADRVAKIMRGPLDNGHIAKAQMLLQENKMVATTIAHGDLLCSNMIVTANGIYVIDWEKSLEAYAGYDFARLALRYPANPFFRRAAHKALVQYQQGQLSLADIKILRQAVTASHAYA